MQNMYMDTATYMADNLDIDRIACLYVILMLEKLQNEPPAGFVEQFGDFGFEYLTLFMTQLFAKSEE